MPPRGPGKLTKTVKETVLAVFNEMQDDPKNSLKAFAEKYPRDFYQIAARLIPTEITGKVEATTYQFIIKQDQNCDPIQEGL